MTIALSNLRMSTRVKPRHHQTHPEYALTVARSRVPNFSPAETDLSRGAGVNACGGNFSMCNRKTSDATNRQNHANYGQSLYNIHIDINAVLWDNDNFVHARSFHDVDIRDQ